MDLPLLTIQHRLNPLSIPSRMASALAVERLISAIVMMRRSLCRPSVPAKPTTGSEPSVRKQWCYIDNPMVSATEDMSIVRYLSLYGGTRWPPFAAGIEAHERPLMMTMLDATMEAPGREAAHVCLRLWFACHRDHDSCKWLWDNLNQFVSTDDRRWRSVSCRARRDAAYMALAFAQDDQHKDRYQLAQWMRTLYEQAHSLLWGRHEDTGLCCVCLDEMAARVLEPCGHLCLCAADCRSLTATGPFTRRPHCPLCRAEIEATWALRPLDRAQPYDDDSEPPRHPPIPRQPNVSLLWAGIYGQFGGGIPLTIRPWHMSTLSRLPTATLDSDSDSDIPPLVVPGHDDDDSSDDMTDEDVPELEEAPDDDGDDDGEQESDSDDDTDSDSDDQDDDDGSEREESESNAQEEHEIHWQGGHEPVQRPTAEDEQFVVTYTGQSPLEEIHFVSDYARVSYEIAAHAIDRNGGDIVSAIVVRFRVTLLVLFAPLGGLTHSSLGTHHLTAVPATRRRKDVEMGGGGAMMTVGNMKCTCVPFPSLSLSLSLSLSFFGGATLAYIVLLLRLKTKMAPAQGTRNVFSNV